MASLWLLSHGHTEWNSGKPGGMARAKGWVNIPLDSKGQDQAEELASKMTSMVPKGTPIHSSDLDRTMETSQVIGKALSSKVEPTKELRPWDIGFLEGRPAKAAEGVMNHFAQYSPRKALTGGESFDSWATRFGDFLTERLAEGQDQILVAHRRHLRLAEAMIRGKGKIDVPYFTQKGDPGTGNGIHIFPSRGWWDWEPIGD